MSHTGPPAEKAKAAEPLGVSALRFTKVSDYTTFYAEYALKGEDIIFHFYLPEELQEAPWAQVGRYWKEGFPKTLSEVSMEYFQAGPPRLKAAYTDEMRSWWMRAGGFAQTLDPARFVEKFFAKLDQALDAEISKP